MTAARNLTAVLGPTNTGKTHLAVERLLGSPSGMIGLPLRLLAREVYDRVRARAGEQATALITGEEKIIPPEPRYWVCTVEAMPSDVEVSFLAIDEVQLAADFERGHIFTDRLLSRRGRDETMLLGAQTMRGAIEELLPGTNFVTRPRFSKLAWAGQKKLTRLPRRSAIVAFSAEMVYGLAELVRRQRGGAAVVLGALSPRTRNAQVALYQSGDVDYIVATDAIGMGLNMDVDHVAFAARRKFDGFHHRNLSAAELAQIAGRAGRHMNDGTFGVTGEADPFEPELIERLEDHRFEPVRVLQWRNRDLGFGSLDELRASLLAMPRHPRLTRAQTAPDLAALEALIRDEASARLASGPQAVARLWEVCQIPDYRNISAAEHASLVSSIFRFLMTGPGRIPQDWFARQLGYCNSTEGDIDTLSNRIAHIRTWTFAANRGDWLDDPLHWQGLARDIEDRLSDALHERLIQRFIDRRTSVLMRRLRQKEELMSSIEEDGAIHVEGEYVGRIKGFNFIPDGSAGAHGKTLKAASLKAVAHEIQARAQAVAAAPDPDLSLTREGHIVWQRAEIAKLVAGPEPLKPRVQLIAEDQLTGADRDAVQLRLETFLRRHISAVLEPLVNLAEAEDVAGLARGVAFRLVERLGVVAREEVAQDLKSLAQPERATLRKHGVRFGALHVFIPALLKPAATELRLLLWGLGLERDGVLTRRDLPAIPGQGLTSVPFDRSTPMGFYRTVGFRPCGARAVRIDMLERLSDLIRARVFWKPGGPEQARPNGSVEGGGFTVVPEMMSIVGCSGEEFSAILRSLGFRSETRRIPIERQPPETAAGAPPQEQVPGLAIEPTDGVVAAFEPHGVEAAGFDEAVAEEGAVAHDSGEAPATGVLQAEPGEAGYPTAEAVNAGPAETGDHAEVEVWWPKDTGPFRKERRSAEPRRAAGKHRPARKATPDRAAKPKPPARPREEPPSDSPFAVLGALKAELMGRKP